MRWQVEDGGQFTLRDGEKLILTGFAEASDIAKRKIDTRTAELVSAEITESGLTVTYQAANGLVLREILSEVRGVPSARCVLSDKLGNEVETNHLEPVVFRGNRDFTLPWIDDLSSKMLFVPYDNDLWNRYELAPFRAGRVSYDLTVLTREGSREGFLMGALDFDTWKNGFVCSHTARPEIHAVSGIADLGTHDVCPHGYVAGREVESSRIVFMYGDDYRTLMEDFGDLIDELYPHREWEEGVPFGFNNFAGLGLRMNLDYYRSIAEFLREELLPRGFGNNNTNYMNLDGFWDTMDFDGRMRIKEEIQAKGQRAGIYDSPFVISPWITDIESEIPEVPGVKFKDILIRDEDGEILPAVDGLVAMDATHPAWIEMTRKKFENFREWNYDYLKADFLAHGALEGVRYDKSVRTGRQALNGALRLINELCDNMGHPFFLSASLAPLFPCGYAHSRRSCCDSFGTNDYVEYVLNAQTYGWWENRRLYAFNDPDQLTLLSSFSVNRDSLEGEARARYTTGAIAGSVMLLSDDYDRPEAVERALKFATNSEVNDIARSRTAFLPVEWNGSSDSHVYTAVIGGEFYMAVFSWRSVPEEISVDVSRTGFPEGTYRDLWTGSRFRTENGCFTWRSEGCDALLLKYEK